MHSGACADNVGRVDLLRTPDERFDDLPDFPFEPSYTDVADGIRIHHVDEGAGPAVLLMHGEPTWSFLYRRMTQRISEAGHRVIVPDLVGFGRSDKPTALGDHTYEGHVAWMLEWLRQTDLDGVTLFCQDWGGLIGLRLVAAEPDRFARFAVANRQAWQVLSGWDKPCLTLFSDGDPITAGGERIFQKLVPGAEGQPHRTITGAGHFLQEDAHEELSEVMIEWMR